uniref:Uncharacterized protein n=1 Tax=Hordeum vulgare subsp. vulgare TaxID=112509 RepID=A0A8I6X2X7_HORVV
MASQVSKTDLEVVLTQAMMAAKNVRAQHGRLLELHRRLHRHHKAAAADAEDDRLGGLASDILNVYYLGLEAGAKMLARCIDIAVDSRAMAAVNIAFALMPDEQLYDALLAQRLPPRPATQAQAFARVEAALLAVKMLEEHHLPRCVECLAAGRAPVPGKPHDPDSEEPRHDAAAASGRSAQGAGLPAARKQDRGPRREAHRPHRRRALPLRRPQGGRPARRAERQARLPGSGS